MDHERNAGTTGKAGLRPTLLFYTPKAGALGRFMRKLKQSTPAAPHVTARTWLHFHAVQVAAT